MRAAWLEVSTYSYYIGKTPRTSPSGPVPRAYVSARFFAWRVGATAEGLTNLYSTHPARSARHNDNRKGSLRSCQVKASSSTWC